MPNRLRNSQHDVSVSFGARLLTHSSPQQVVIFDGKDRRFTLNNLARADLIWRVPGHAPASNPNGRMTTIRQTLELRKKLNRDNPDLSQLRIPKDKTRARRAFLELLHAPCRRDARTTTKATTDDLVVQASSLQKTRAERAFHLALWDGLVGSRPPLTRLAGKTRS